MIVFEYWFTYTTPLNFIRFKGIIKAFSWNECAAHVNNFSKLNKLSSLQSFLRSESHCFEIIFEMVKS